MRMLIAAAALILAGIVPALAEVEACGQSREAGLAEAKAVAPSVNGEVVEITDATEAQKTADMIFEAVGKPSQPIASMIILKVGAGAMVALYDAKNCFVVGVRMPVAMLVEMIGRSA